MSYVVIVEFQREWSDDGELVERRPEYAGLTYREAFKEQFRAELQEAYDRSEGALAGLFNVMSVRSPIADQDKALDDKVKQPSAMQVALEKIRDARDYHAEHGKYPKGTLKRSQSFDDWAADVAEQALKEK